MYFTVGLHGQATSVWPGSSGAPTVCMHGTKGPSEPSTSSTAEPIRVMIFMFTATYAESVISTPIWAIGEPSGPMLNGITYIVRPRIDPANRSPRIDFISAGSIQLFVGPASWRVRLQMNVRSSTRATSLGSERARKLPGRNSSFNAMNVPASTNSCVNTSDSASEPSHQWTRSGSHKSVISATHDRSSSFWRFSGVPMIGDRTSDRSRTTDLCHESTRNMLGPLADDGGEPRSRSGSSRQLLVRSPAS